MGSRREILLYGGFAAIIVCAVFVAHFLGMSFYVITGGSMEGAVPKGAVAIERSVATDTLQVGDVITFQPPNNKGSVTHRIIGIDADEAGRRVYTTKGDANEAIDPWRFTLDRPEQAKFVTSIPWLGYFLAFFTLRIVRTVLLAGLGTALLVALVVWFRESAEDAGDESFADDGVVQR
jgi:signal peptidase I